MGEICLYPSEKPPAAAFGEPLSTRIHTATGQRKTGGGLSGKCVSPALVRSFWLDYPCPDLAFDAAAALCCSVIATKTNHIAGSKNARCANSSMPISKRQGIRLSDDRNRNPPEISNDFS
jgi:hypothetical protein